MSAADPCGRRTDLTNCAFRCRNFPPSDSIHSKTRRRAGLGVFYASELDGLFGGDGRAIRPFKWRAVQLNTASRYLNVGVPIFLEFVLHRFARAQNRCVQLVVLTDLDRAIPPSGEATSRSFPAFPLR